MIMVLAGTTEGRELTNLLQKVKYSVAVSVLNSYGADLLSLEAGSKLLTGKLERDSFLQCVKNNNICAVVDATHPFAVNIRKLAIEITNELGLPYIRLERPQTELLQHPLIKQIDHLDQAANYLEPGMRVFSTLGSNHLEALLNLVKENKADLTVRVLPTVEVVNKCINAGLSPAQIAAIQGPFSKELNRELFKHYEAGLILSKESGTAGGLDSKIAAALELKIPIVVWNRPHMEYSLAANTCQEVLDYLDKFFKEDHINV